MYINKVVHKIYLKVNENGAEVATVTVVEIDEMAMQEEDKIYDMKENRPFLFFLWNSELPEQHNLIFMSKIEKL